MKRQNNAETKWFEGIWFGSATGSSETLIGTYKGVVRASTIKRQDQSQRWDKKMMREMQGTPQQPDPSKPGLHIPARIRMDPPVQVDVLELRPQREEDMPKRAYIKATL